jgi:hypothetical protein
MNFIDPKLKPIGVVVVGILGMIGISINLNLGVKYFFDIF